MSNNRENKSNLDELLHDQQERLKELACINRTTAILKESKTIEETLQKIVLTLPIAWQYPDFTVARITYDTKVYTTLDFDESKWVQSQQFDTLEHKTGSIEIFYTKEFEVFDEGPFLDEERDLLINLSSLITGYINSHLAKKVIKVPEKEPQIDQYSELKSGRKLLQRFLERQNAERDAFHDLMPFKVKEILLVANLYDAYAIEGEGRFSEHILGEYYQLNLSNVPRVTGVSGEEEVFTKLKSRHYDMIIIMLGVDKENPIKIIHRIKKKYPYIPTFLLINSPGDVLYIKEQQEIGVPFDGYYVWTGESKVFFAMVKSLEDKVNAENDTRIGLSRVILLVEDSAEYYS